MPPSGAVLRTARVEQKYQKLSGYRPAARCVTLPYIGLCHARARCVDRLAKAASGSIKALASTPLNCPTTDVRRIRLLLLSSTVITRIYATILARRLVENWMDGDRTTSSLKGRKFCQRRDASTCRAAEIGLLCTMLNFEHGMPKTGRRGMREREKEELLFAAIGRAEGVASDDTGSQD